VGGLAGHTNNVRLSMKGKEWELERDQAEGSRRARRGAERRGDEVRLAHSGGAAERSPDVSFEGRR
jgi:hypothetical protein